MDRSGNSPTAPPLQPADIRQTIGELLGTDPNHTLIRRLAERRISPDVIMTFDIRVRGDGWTYPTPRGALRFKNANSDAPNKYAWIGEERDALLYGFDLREAIQQAGGDVWLVTEFDFFAMHSAGISHVIAQLQGEASVPKELPALFQSMGALTCYIAPDRDDQGTAWAQLVANKLIPAGIEVYARELPFPLEKKHGGDIGRLWQEYNRAQPFERYLLNLPVTALQEENEGKREKLHIDHFILEDRKVQIARLLGVTSYNSKGYSENLACPFHDDRNPSAALHREYGLHCFTEAKWYKWRDLATVVGMQWETVTPAPVYCENALGDELIQAMIKTGYSALASTLETAYRAGWLPGREITIKSLISLGIPEWRVRKAFAQMEGREADRRKQNHRSKIGERESNFCGELTPFFLFPKEASILNKNSGRGRHAKTKVLPDPTSLAQVFGVKVLHYTQIAQKPKLADWCAEVYAAQIDLDPGTHPRKELCRPLGISPTTGRAYDKRAGVTVTSNEKRIELKNDDALPVTPDLKATWLETDEIVDEKGHQKFKRFSATKGGYSRALISAAKLDGRVWLVKQLANDYRRARP